MEIKVLQKIAKFIEPLKNLDKVISIFTNLQHLETQFIQYTEKTDTRLNLYENAVDTRLDERLTAIEIRLDERTASVDTRLDERLATIETHMDERLEKHELKIDETIKRMSLNATDRCDVMLQLFEQRLDQFRIAFKSFQKNSQSEIYETVKPVQSFGKLANVAIANGTVVKKPVEPCLYDKIIAFKQDPVNQTTIPVGYEKEIANYVISFQDNPQDIEYIQIHLRRFLATLKRLPPAQSDNDKLLELGSLSHMIPAIKKYSGYKNVTGSDLINSDEKIIQRTIRQTGVKENAESFTYEVSNFDVESDVFPYPDEYFKIVLCCELIEHLKSDPMHMLWECNRVMQPDGYLILTTPNIASYRALEAMLVHCSPYLMPQFNISNRLDQHYREFAPNEIRDALEAAGFTVAELDSEDVWTTPNPAIIEMLKTQNISTKMRGDNLFAIARKTSSPKERYPKFLYRGF